MTKKTHLFQQMRFFEKKTFDFKQKKSPLHPKEQENLFLADEEFLFSKNIPENNIVEEENAFAEVDSLQGRNFR